ncbi:MAG: hypothetical protein ACKPKO_23200, partial [Candidatus Fonsibacter sp.]
MFHSEADANMVTEPIVAQYTKYDGACVSEDGADVDVRRSLYVPGCLHVVHNITKDLGRTIAHFGWFIIKLV